jgi:hypothetical protein
MSVELDDLIGEHALTGVDFENVKGGYWDDDANQIRFVLDGKIYVATENPEDGYRSALGTLEIVTEPPVKNTFPATKVTARKGGGYDDDILELVAENGEVVLRVGTADTSDYYPYFVGTFDPKKLPANEGK